MTPIDEIKKEADELGIQYHKNISSEKLQARIEEFYEAQETSGPALVEAVQEKEKKEEKAKDVEKPEKKVDQRTLTRIAREEAARSTRIVTIIDNDQRVNNQTTTCTVNCSNEFFDLGTVVLPLNERIEVAMGHIRTLQQVQIPLHVRDSRTGLSQVRLRPRYTVTFT